MPNLISYPEIYFTRLDHTGNRLGSENRITFNDKHSHLGTLLWSGSEYCIAYFVDQFFPSYDIYFVLLDNSGYRLGNELRITFSDSNATYPSLVWTGSEYGLAWQDNRDNNREIHFTRINRAGTKLIDNTRITFNDKESFYPSLLWTGSEFGLFWIDGFVLSNPTNIMNYFTHFVR